MTLLEISSRIMDLYYQDYPPGDVFIELEDFKFQVAAKYSELLNLAYRQSRAEGKALDGFSNIELSAFWLTDDKVKIQYSTEEDKHYINTSLPVFSFDFDGFANGIQDVFGFGPKSKDYRKIMLNEVKFQKALPTTSKVFYYLNSDTEIVFLNGAVEGASVKVQYAPAVIGLENDCKLSDTVASAIIKEVLNVMMAARNSTVVQEVIDQNSNITQQNQSNQSLNKA